MKDRVVNRRASENALSGTTIAQNTIYNVIGNVLPLVAALFSIPILIEHIGADRFGILTLAWMVVGYFGLFDLGIGRALTKLVSERIGTPSSRELPELIWTALLVMLIFGLVGGILLASSSSILVYRVLRIPSALQKEAQLSFLTLSISIPVVISTAGLRGVLEAYHRFRMINAVRVPMGLFTFLAPIATLPFSTSLIPITIVLVVGRFVFCILHLYLCLNVASELATHISVNWRFVKALVTFGGWITVTNVVGPIMTYLDRFVIGSVLSIVDVTYYTTPYEMVTKLLLVPTALVSVLFPAFSAGFINQPNTIHRLYSRALKYTFLILFPITISIITFSDEILRIWINAEFSVHSHRVLQWLALGVLINATALIPFTYLQGIGRPDITSKLHLLELPVYFVLLWLLLLNYGVQGSAIAWVLRITFDAAALFLMSHKISKIGTNLLRVSLAFVGVCIIAFGLSQISHTLPKSLVLVSLLAILCCLVWKMFLSSEEQNFIRALVQKILGRHSGQRQ